MCEVFCGSQQNEDHHTPSLVREGGSSLRGKGEDQENGIEGMKEGERVTDALFHIPRIEILHCA